MYVIYAVKISSSLSKCATIMYHCLYPYMRVGGGGFGYVPNTRY